MTRIMAATPESESPFLLPFPKSLSEMQADKEAYSFGLQLPQELELELILSQMAQQPVLRG